MTIVTMPMTMRATDIALPIDHVRGGVSLIGDVLQHVATTHPLMLAVEVAGLVAEVARFWSTILRQARHTSISESAPCCISRGVHDVGRADLGGLIADLLPYCTCEPSAALRHDK